MAKTIFVAGTDTGVGKSVVAASVLAAATARGLSTAACKPVAAGCEETPEGLRNEDALLLMQHQSLSLPYEAVNPFALAPAIAPHIAAQQAGITLSAPSLVTACGPVLARSADLTVIEGAGGWLVPLNTQETLADFAVALASPVLLVVGMRLGCLNHALLTAAAIRQVGLPLLGWVANQIDPNMPCFEENLATLDARLGTPRLGLLRWMPRLNIADTAQCLDISPVI